MRAVTDSGSEIVFDKNKKPAISNLLLIYSALSGKTIKEIEKEYKGKGYGDFKKGLADIVTSFLKDFQDKYYALADSEVLDILAQGKKKAEAIANVTLKKARRAIGIE
jgi:tryptophanyl-tRNA synthetase